jgi:hypothetical protein
MMYDSWSMEGLSLTERESPEAMNREIHKLAMAALYGGTRSPLEPISIHVPTLHHLILVGEGYVLA